MSVRRWGITRGPKELKKIQALAQNKLEELPEARLSFAVGNKQVVVCEAVRKTVDVVTVFKDIINLVVSAEPCSSLARGGIMAILPVGYTLVFPPRRGQGWAGVKQLVDNAIQQDKNAASEPE